PPCFLAGMDRISGCSWPFWQNRCPDGPDPVERGVSVPPSLGAILRTPRLRLRLLYGADKLDTPVRWVAVSELTDPTPYLEGGELLLTTGLRWSHETDAARYVRRLVDRGVAGLGFGLGVVHDQVPST